MWFFRHKENVVPEYPELVNDTEAFYSFVRLEGLERYESYYGEGLSEKKKASLEKQKYNLKQGLKGEERTLNALMRTPLYTLIIKDMRFVYGNIQIQIDFIVITDKIIFVIEAKNWNSDVKIDSNGDFFAIDNQKRYKNPIAQNLDHVEYIKRIYQGMYPGDKSRQFKNVVVWANDSSTLERSEAPDNAADSITYADKLSSYILEQYKLCRGKKLSTDRMRQIADDFMKYCRENSVERKCPICGKKLVERRAKTVFLGCEGYNKGCKYTEQLSCDT